jgi:hypothetical protein
MCSFIMQDLSMRVAMGFAVTVYKIHSLTYFHVTHAELLQVKKEIFRRLFFEMC